MTIYDRIKHLRESQGLSQQELAERVGFKTASAVNKIELGLRDINQYKIIAFARALQTTPAYLMGWEEDLSGITNIIPLQKVRKIPLIGTIACGEPILAQENIEGYLVLPDGVKADFALRCKGDSMINARIYDGDIVYIHLQPTVENGEIVAVLLADENEATLKRFYRNGDTVVLQPENPKYMPLMFSKEEINNLKILGKAVAFLSNVE